MPRPPETTDADARKAEQRRRARMRGIEILAAINEELDEARTPMRFTVASRRRRVGKDGVEVWEVDLEQQSERFTLDEAMEGCRAWWPEPKGSATVLLVQSEHARIVLTKTLGQPPETGGVLLVYPAPFLEALRDLYSRPDLAVEAGLKLAPKLKESPVPVPLNMRSFELGRARPAQLRAVELLSYRRGFLWGPPGTGKTTTLGMLLASVLTYLPDMRVLLLSTTNAAVDQSLVAVDRALESLGHHTEAARTARFKGCKRFGGRFLAATYEGRKHLLRDVDEDVLAELITHESARPPKDDTPALAAWTLRRDELRSVIAQRWREQVARARLVAMTTTGVAYAFDAIAESGKFDYVVFDEGSQVSLAHFGVFATLGRRALVAGDPQQLGPVVVAEAAPVRRWLGRSPFELRDPAKKEGTVVLDEQSRMAEPICRLVANVFYRGRLRVADDSKGSAGWLADRRLGYNREVKDTALHRLEIAEKGEWHAGWKGNVRFESAESIARICRRLELSGSDDIVVLTPFRAQRQLIKVKLEEAGARNVEVWTVHRAQGSEHHTVVFDPVVGSCKFLNTPEARRLVNVALSRARARLVVALSSDDLRNLTLRDVDSVIRGVTLPWQRGFEPLEELYRPGHELELVGRQVVVGDLEGTVVRVRQGHLELHLGAGLFKRVDAAAWMRIVGGEDGSAGLT